MRNLGTKRCPKCNEIKDTVQFGKNRSEKDGLQTYCKLCRKIYQKENKEHIKKYNKEYYQTNKITLRCKYREKQKLYRAINKEKISLKLSEYYEKNKTVVLERNRKWIKNNREKMRSYNNKRRALKRGSTGEYSDADVYKKRVEQRDLCYWCHEALNNKYHIDHVVPLSRGGSNSPENIVISCPKCNLKKGSKLPNEWEKLISNKCRNE